MIGDGAGMNVEHLCSFQATGGGGTAVPLRSVEWHAQGQSSHQDRWRIGAMAAHASSRKAGDQSGRERRARARLCSSNATPSFIPRRDRYSQVVVRAWHNHLALAPCGVPDEIRFSVTDPSISPDPLRILHVLAPAPSGGLESVVRLLASGHRTRGHDVRVAAVLSPGESETAHPFLRSLAAASVPASVVRVSARGYAAERAAIRDLCRDMRPHVVHTHGFRSDVVDAGVARRTKAARVTTVHSLIGNDWKGRLYEAIQLRSLRRFEAVVAVSRVIQDRLVRGGVPGSRVHYLQNAFAPTAVSVTAERARQELGAPPDRPLIGWVGRFSREKGADVMLEAFARVTRSSALLAMLGDGPAAGRLRAQARSLGIADRVIWPGRVHHAERLFAAFDVFALSSRTEGTPIALLEAMAAARPIVATRVGGVPDVVDESCGRLVRSEDAPALAAAIGELLDDRRLAKTYGEAARTVVESRFSVTPWLLEYERLYARLSESQRP